MNKDILKGKWEQVKGRAKQAAGDISNNERLHDEGVGDEAAGNVREGVGKARRKVGDYRKNPQAARQLIAVGESKPAANIEAGELAAWTTVAGVILNLDETITKE